MNQSSLENTAPARASLHIGEDYNLHDVGRVSPSPTAEKTPLNSKQASVDMFRQISNRSLSILNQISSNQSVAGNARRGYNIPFISATETAGKPVDEDVAMSLARRGKQFLRAGHYHQALDLFDQALPLQREAFGRRHKNVGVTMNNMGVAYKYMGKEYYNLAKSSFEEALSIFQECLGPEHDVTASAACNLWSLLRHMAQQQARDGQYVSRDFRRIVAKTA